MHRLLLASRTAVRLQDEIAASGSGRPGPGGVLECRRRGGSCVACSSDRSRNQLRRAAATAPAYSRTGSSRLITNLNVSMLCNIHAEIDSVLLFRCRLSNGIGSRSATFVRVNMERKEQTSLCVCAEAAAAAPLLRSLRSVAAFFFHSIFVNFLFFDRNNLSCLSRFGVVIIVILILIASTIERRTKSARDNRKCYRFFFFHRRPKISNTFD